MRSGVEAQVHWLSGTTVLEEEEVLPFIDGLVPGMGFEVVDRGMNGYGRRYVTPYGLIVLVDPWDFGSMPPVCVVASGSVCEFLGSERVRELASILKPTRVDFAWDGVPFTVGEVAEWVQDGNMRSRFRKAGEHRPLLESPGEGRTVTLGSGASTGQLCVYDRRGDVRAELRLKGERAEVAYGVLQLDPSEWSGAFVALLRGLVDFVDRGHAVRADDCPLLASWESFVAGAERVVVALHGKVAPSFERAREWIYRQVAPTLVALVRGGLPISDVLFEGGRRSRGRHRALARVWAVGSLPALSG